MNRTAVASCIALVLSFGTASQATPITYSFTGTGTGVIGGTAFADAPFQFILNADTTQVALEPMRGAIGIMDLLGRFTIDGVGTVTFTRPTFVFGGNGRDLIRFGDDTVGNYIAIFDDTLGLAAYDLRSNFGPITSHNDNLDQFHDIPTDRGLLTYSVMSPVTFRSTVDATVPEPALVLLMGAGLVLAAVRLRRAPVLR